MKKNLTDKEIVEELWQHSIRCKEIDDLVASITQDDTDPDFDPNRTAEENLFGQATLLLKALLSDREWDKSHILELKRFRRETALSELYYKQKSERLSEENAKLLKSNEFLKDELNQLASFNPDWDILEATRESLRTYMMLVRKVWKMADKMQEEANSLMEQKRYDGGAHLDHWAGQIRVELEDV